MKQLMPVLETILLVEDNADDVTLIKAAFRRAGIRQRLEVVADGVQAICYLSGEGAYHDRTLYPFPGLVLLDLRLPEQDGFAVLRWLHGHPDILRRVIPLVLTGDASEASSERALAMGARKVLVKPLALRELESMMMGLKMEFLEPPQPLPPSPRTP